LGLNPGNSYTFKAIVYKDLLWSSGINKTSQVAEIKEVTNLQHYASNQEIVLNWNNPNFNCPDEVMVVVRKDSAVTTAPSGDGSAYTADANFTNGTDIGSMEYAIYKGTNDGITITGLTNGETYYYSIFVRDGSSWSDGIQGYDTPNDISILFQGDIAVLAINTNNSTGDDEISLVCFDTLKTGTAIDLTDNGWEREYPDYWGSTEGVIRFTRTGPDILPGQVFTFIGTGHLSSDFSATGLSDNSWAVSSINGSWNFNLSSTDQILVLQYGTWTYGSSNQSTYSGNVLYGWTATGWAGDSGHGTIGSTSYSALYPSIECFNTNVGNTGNSGKVKYSGPTASATQREWIARINIKDNWSGYADNASFNAAVPVYTSGDTLDIAISSYSDGEWIGDNDSNWFNCGNWSDLAVPDKDKNVIISANAQRKCSISAQAENSDNFNDTASCKNLTISDSTLYLSSADDILSIHGNLTLNSGVFSPNSGKIFITGNWINNSFANVFPNNSTSLIDGVVTLENPLNIQLIGGLNPTYFENLVIIGSDKILTNNNNSVNNILLVNSPLILNSNTFEIKNPNPMGITYESGFIESETLPGNHGFIKWNTGSFVGTFTVPFGSNAPSGIDDLSLSLTIKQPMGNSDFFTFATYPTDMFNQPMPTSSTPLETEIRKVVDRYWLINPSDVNNLPNLDIAFSYATEDVSKTKNSINTDKLKASRNNTTLGKWLDMEPRGNNYLNTVEIKDVTPSEFYNIWTLVNNPPVLTDLFTGDAFSPNGDGLNDVFIPIFQTDFEVIDYELVIFNRWGKVVFQTKDRNEGWNGIPQGTSDKPQVDVYSWIIIVKGRVYGDAEADGKKQKFTGRVTLVL